MASTEPQYRAVFWRAVNETRRIVLAHSWSALVWKLFVAAAGLVMAFLFIEITPADDINLFTDKIALGIVAIATAVVLVIGVFFVQLLVAAPLQLWRAEWDRAEGAERRCRELSGDGPIRDRTDVYRAAAYMIFGEWDRSLQELTPEDQVVFVHSKLNMMVQDASDGHLDIWVKRQRHGGTHINPGKEYWGDHHIEWDAGTLKAKANPGVSRQSDAFDPLVRKSDIEKLYG